MARVERGNVVLHIDDNEVDYYLRLGYNLTNELGRVITDAVPHDTTALQNAYVESQKKITELEETIAELTAELDRYKAAEAKPVRKKTTATK